MQAFCNANVASRRYIPPAGLTRTTMNFALLGDDPVCLPLISAIAGHPEHRLTQAAHAPSIASAVLESVPSVHVCPRWEDFPFDGSLDAVIVAGDDPQTLIGAKQLAAAGKPLILFPRVTQSSTLIYELTLIRDDTKVVLFPAFALRMDPQVARLRELIENKVFGESVYLQLTRGFGRTRHAGQPRLPSIDEVDEMLLHDVDLLRSLGGNYDQVTAIHSGVTPAGVLLATVTLAGSGCVEVTWTLTSSGTAAADQLQVTGATGSAVLTLSDNLATQLTIEGIEPLQAAADEDGDAGNVWLRRFEAALAGDSVHPDWIDVTRAFEIVDATHRSIRRRRTIDLHFETTSERTIFKTQMTAIGCGVLTFTLLGLVCYLIAANLFAVNETVLRVARIAWALPPILFLLLQLLMFVAKPSSQAAEKAEPSNDH